MFELTTRTKRTNVGQQQYELELHRLRIEYEKLLAMYTIILPKINPALIADLLSREIEYDNNKDKNAPMYTVEVFTKKVTDSEKAKMYIIQKTGMVPAIYDNGTHYVTNQRLTLEMLKEISDCDDVLEVYGEYSGSCASIGAVHECRKEYE
jgi:hypothetical protein